MTEERDIGRPVPVHASGGSVVVENCIVCGLPYEWHDHGPKNWLACPTREQLVAIEAELESQLEKVTVAIKAALAKSQATGGE